MAAAWGGQVEPRKPMLHHGCYLAGTEQRIASQDRESRMSAGWKVLLVCLILAGFEPFAAAQNPPLVPPPSAQRGELEPGDQASPGSFWGYAENGIDPCAGSLAGRSLINSIGVV